MEKQVNVKIVLGIMCAVMIIMLTVAFAHFSRMLKSAGQGKVDPANFDIHFKNLSEPILHGGAEVTGTPTIASEGAKINNIAVTLKLPGDYALYTVDIENSGDINVEVSNIERTNLDNSLLELEVVYTDTEERLQTGDELQPSEVKNITIKIKYKDIEDPDLLPDQIQTINFSYSVTYTQSNNEALYYTSGLPTSYIPVEYLESKETQYIDTGVLNSSENRVYVKFMQTKSGINRIVGERNTSSSAMFMVVDSVGSGYFQYGNQDYDPSATLSSNVIRNWDMDKNKLYLDGELAKTFSEQSFSTTNSLYLFGNNGQTGGGNLRIYECKIYTNDVLVRNFIPALDENYRPCMYDTVTHTPYYNQGASEFLYIHDYSSEDIYASGLPKIFTELEYLESTGTQYINTNTSFYNIGRIEFKFIIRQLVENNSNYTIFGKNTGSGEVLLFYRGNGVTYLNGTRITHAKPNINQLYDVIFDITNGNASLTINNNMVGTSTGSSNSSSSYIMNLFKADSCLYMQIYSFTCTNNEGDLLFNFIPALDPSGRPCMYDTVSHTPFYNQGTGEFLYPTSE